MIPMIKLVTLTLTLMIFVLAGCASTEGGEGKETSTAMADDGAEMAAEGGAADAGESAAGEVAAEPEKSKTEYPIRPRSYEMDVDDIGIWKDPSFKRWFAQSYIAESDVEPSVTIVEREQLLAVLELISNEQTPEAIALLEQTKSEATSAVFDFMLGNLYFQQDDFVRAAENLKRATDKYPKFRRAWRTIGLLKMRESDFANAIIPFTKVIELGGGDAVTYGLLGFAYSNIENDVAAESAFRQANLLDPRTDDWRMGLARSFFKQNRFADAVALTQLLINENENRPDQIAVHPTDQDIIYVGNVRGGIYKTTDGGNNWNPVFDTQSTLTIGYITLDPQDPNTVWVGTGDPNIPGSAATGDGIYKSTDGGLTWTHKGLSAQRVISKIIVHPTDSNTVYAATMGIPMERNNDRGLYKTTDGGNSWSQILFISNDAGVTDLMMDPTNSQILYAAGWNRIRTNQESLISGPAAKVYKSIDGGQNWTVLTGGLPQYNSSRIGLAMSAQNPNTIFAMYVDTNLTYAGTYKSTNGGTTWTLLPLNSLLQAGAMGGFGWYFGKIVVNPWDEDEMHVGAVDLYVTGDGGTTWALGAPEWWTYQVHADKHDIVYVSEDSILLATDGGLYKTVDGGANWIDIENISNTQFYRVAYNPHNIGEYIGGAQDNGTTSGNEANLNNWQRVLGGDGFQPIYHPTNNQILWAETQRGGINVSTDGGLNFNSGTNGIDPTDRRNWDCPYIMSSHNPNTLYTGTYRVYKNTAGSNPNWFDISSDLTDGIIFRSTFHTISTIAESPINAQHLYVGTSDANVWRTLNGGTNWTNITATLPDRYVTSVKASPNNVNTIFVTHSGYKYNDYIPHVHKSLDNGTTWIDISGNLPQIAVNDIVVYDGNDDVLFVATDGGVYNTIDGGTTWNRVGNNMPVIPVFDLEIEPVENKLIAGTFAKSMMTFPIDSILISTEVEEVVSDDKLMVFPNPAVDQITITSETDMRIINIFDIKGDQVKRLEVSTRNLILNINDLPAGKYFMQIEGQNNISHKVFLKL